MWPDHLGKPGSDNPKCQTEKSPVKKRDHHWKRGQAGVWTYCEAGRGARGGLAHLCFSTRVSQLRAS